MAKCVFTFRDGSKVEIEGRTIKDVMEAFQRMMDNKSSPLIDMKIITPGILNPAFLKATAQA